MSPPSRGSERSCSWGAPANYMLLNTESVEGGQGCNRVVCGRRPTTSDSGIVSTGLVRGSTFLASNRTHPTACDCMLGFSQVHCSSFSVGERAHLRIFSVGGFVCTGAAKGLHRFYALYIRGSWFRMTCSNLLQTCFL